MERPLRLRFDLSEQQRQRLQLDATVLKLKDDRAQQLDAALEKLVGQAPWLDDGQFFVALLRPGRGSPLPGWRRCSALF